MAQNTSQTAKIYQFPTRPTSRTVRAVRGAGVGERAALPYAPVEFGSGWYHEAAILEAEKSLKP